MSEKNELDLYDYALFLLKWKTKLIVIFISTLIISYLCVFFFVEEQYDSTAVIMPIENNDVSGLTSLTKNLSSLPFGLGSSLAGSGATNDLFVTILFSRTNLDLIIDKYNLMEDYKVKKRFEARKILASNIMADETKEGAFTITIRTDSPDKSADMANFIVKRLNEKVIEMNISKSKSKKEFLETRYDDIKSNLKISEDKLKSYQQNSKMVEAESQVKALLEEYIKLESDLEKKRLDYNMLKKVLSENNPQVLAAKETVIEYEKMVNKVKTQGLDNSFFVSADKIPEESMNYFRLYRDVQIYNAMLEYIVPMYEQSKFEEVNDMPVIQIVDEAVPPERRSYPTRSIISLAVAFAVTFIVASFILMKEVADNSDNDKLKKIKDHLKFSRKRNNVV